MKTEVAESLRSQLNRLEEEAAELDPLLRDRWENHPGHFAATLWGLVMSAFAFLDLVSWYWTAKKKPQGERMVNFLEKYVGTDRDAAFMAVEMWRHTLMHTGEPRYLRREDTDTRHSWLLHWSTEMDREDHLRLPPAGGDESQARLSLAFLLEDLQKALEAYLTDLEAEPDLAANLESVHPKVVEQVVHVPEWL